VRKRKKNPEEVVEEAVPIVEVHVKENVMLHADTSVVEDARQVVLVYAQAHLVIYKQNNIIHYE